MWKKYRDGIISSGGLMETEKARRKSLVSKIKQSIEQNRGCGVLYLDTVMPDGFGEDSIFVSNVRLLVDGIKYSVCNAEKTCGKVINEQNITKCDTTFAELGESSGIAHLDDVSLARKLNGVRLTFDKII